MPGSQGISELAWRHRQFIFLATTAGLLLVGIVSYLVGQGDFADWAWVLATVIGLVVSIAWIAAAARHRQPTVDVIAALALAGALAIQEPLAGAVIALMLATGRALEERSRARAERELTLLVARAPNIARRRNGGDVVEVPVNVVEPGDQIVVGSGDLIPVDGRLVSDAEVDESSLTGEPMPVRLVAGDTVRSGTVNSGPPFEFTATATAENSEYSSIVRLVTQAQANTAPFVRIADRFALVFVPLTLLFAGFAWAISGSAVRAVAVLVVATPCPLILAAPIAFISGMAQASRHGVVVKGGSALERLARGKVMLFDKTGTLTRGQPMLSNVIVGDHFYSPNECLAFAASLDQISPHVIANAIVAAARQQSLDLEMPTSVAEISGYGLTGQVGSRTVSLGKLAWLAPDGPPAWARQASRRADIEGSLAVFLSVDDQLTAALLFDDPIRPDAARMIRSMRRAGIKRTVLVSGDRADVASMVARLVGIDRVAAERDPEEKVCVVQEESSRGPTVMVGDGVNDAPALAEAGVGVAIATRGSSASSETADVVLVVDHIDALADAMRIAQRSRFIALAAVTLGMGLSLLAMIFAAAGLLAPVAGAILQEGIDVLAICVALLALVPIRKESRALQPDQQEIVSRLFDQHNELKEVVEQVRTVADDLSDADTSIDSVKSLLVLLENEQIPHERAEEDELYPVVAQSLGGHEPMAMMSRSHAEIEHQVKRLRRIVDNIDSANVTTDDLVEIRRVLYGLYAVLKLHNAQEEDIAFSMFTQKSPA